MTFQMMLLALIMSTAAANGSSMQSRMPRPCPLPRLKPMPPVVTGSTPGTWAHDTMTRRIREDILQRVYEDNGLTPGSPSGELAKACAGLDELCRELEAASTTTLRPIADDGSADAAYWNDVILKPHMAAKETYLSAPWFVSEFYVYRRVVEAFAGTGVDPFCAQKEAGLQAALEAMDALALRLLGSVGACGRPKGSMAPSLTAAAQMVRVWSLCSLWGNQADLSLWPVPLDEETVEDGCQRMNRALLSGKERLLADHFADCWSDLAGCSRPPGSGTVLRSIGLVTDNAGGELCTDLMLAHALVAGGICEHVSIHCKKYPVFVSDATPEDVMHSIEALQASPWGSCATLGKAFEGHVQAGRWSIEDDAFWCQGIEFWEMPRELAVRLNEHDLCIVKGDANYRRLVGDRQWDLDASFHDIAGYFPTRLLALRAPKSEVGCGIPEDRLKLAAKEDENWITSGNYGLVHYTSGQKDGWALGAGQLDDPTSYLG